MQKEQEEYFFLQNKFPDDKVICPNNDLGELLSFDEYLKVVAQSNIVAFSEYNNVVTKGVHGECSLALELGIPVFVLRKNKRNRIEMQAVIGFKLLPNPQTYEYSIAVLKNPPLNN